ncbi:MAG: uracil-DNA glycosylase [Caloramator sp.]|nr:uracil-DNA glycosylase [Caloramator sp.]
MYRFGEVSEIIKTCNKCPLCNKRKNVVFGEGNINTKIMFIGEGPGEEEDNTGRPFVGKAGQLLTKMLAAIELKREDVYIANIVKCRPPNNRVPLEEEVVKCLPYLRYQVSIIKPKIIVCLGATSSKYIIKNDIRITKDRGIWYKKGNFYIIPTYHPAALLRDPSKKKEAWEDFKNIREKLKML